MKNKGKLGMIFMLASSITASSCNKEEPKEDVQTPREIETYVNKHFPQQSIIQTQENISAGILTYDVSLTNNIALVFNDDYDIIDIDDDDALPESVIPNYIIDFVEENYPGAIITDWEIDDENQEVELNTGEELIFSLDGDFIGFDDDVENESDNDNDENDDVMIDISALPGEITTFIASNFPNQPILLATQEMDDSETTYEVHLEGGITLEFGQNNQIEDIDALSELPDAIIPPSILQYVDENYANNYIVSWEIDEDNQQVELDNDLELTFDLNGGFIGLDD